MWSSISCGIVVTSIFIECAAHAVAVDELAKQLLVDKDKGQCDLNHDDPLDSTSLMQGANVHVHLNGLAHDDVGELPNKHQMHVTTELGQAPILSFFRNDSSRVLTVFSAISMQVHEHLQHRTEILGSAGSIFLILFLLVASLLCAVFVCAAKRNPQGFEVGDSRNGSIMGQWHHPPREVQRGPHSGGRTPNDQSAPVEAPWSSLSLAGSWLGTRTPNWKGTCPPPSQSSLQQPGGDTFSLSPRALPNLPPSPGSRFLPPPLCPTLVLPVCEARFGIRVQQLVALAGKRGNGELGIVGLSGNTLLRAVLRSEGGHRMLEISMPEANSAPRATVGPGLIGARSLEIRALKGSFYGTLEMRHRGACYVIKDGVTVLLIDGDTDNLQLSIKSNQGAELAAIRVSTELFGGSDHVEIRVEPGVDTVLVLSVVLAVLLLSP